MSYYYPNQLWISGNGTFGVSVLFGMSSDISSQAGVSGNLM